MSDATNEAAVAAGQIQMSQDEYYMRSEERSYVTPENIGGLLEYPALFRAMRDDRELRPARSPAMTTGRAMNDFLTLSAAEFGERYTVEDGPVNPKTGKPYGTETKMYLDWFSKQEKTPVSTGDYAMFAKMTKAYDEHSFVKSLSGWNCMCNVVYGATVKGTPCLVKVDKLYSSGDTVIAVDVKTTSDLCAFHHSANSLYYREQQALIGTVLSACGIDELQTYIVAVEKGPMPRCGVFSVRGLDCMNRVSTALAEYGEGLRTGVFSTGFEGLKVL